MRTTTVESAKRFVPNRTLVYMFLPPQVEPPCSYRCTGCYVLASEAYPKRVKRSEERIIADLKELTASGYSVIPSTTEILMNARYLEMLSAVKTTYVLTNGKLIVSKPSILEGLKRIGVVQIVLTANFGDSGLILPNLNVFSEAVRSARRAGLEVMARITLTKENYLNILEMIAGCRQFGVRCIQFLRFMPIERGPEMLDENDAKKVFEMLEVARNTNPDMYISAGGSLGSQFRRKKFVCTAGKTQFAIGLDDRVYPCIYLTQNENAIGIYENDKVVIDKEFTIGGNELDCPAYLYFASQAKNSEQEAHKPEEKGR
ncbi:MAG: radical SAM protein [Candidatus Micrarchaeota archaeon]